MKNSYQWLGNFITYLPMLYVALIWDQMPARVPVHFTETGQADQFSARDSWLWTLLLMFGLFISFRSSVLSLLLKRVDLPRPRQIILQLLTASFVACVLLIYILQSILSAPIYTDYLPVLLSFFGAVILYFTDTKPRVPMEKSSSSAPADTRTQILQYLQTVSLLVTVRVNLLAGLIMLFAQSADRWMIGILANLLAFGCLTLLAYRQLKDVV